MAVTVPAVTSTRRCPMRRARSRSTSIAATTRRARSPLSRPVRCRRRKIASTSRSRRGRRLMPSPSALIVAIIRSKDIHAPVEATAAVRRHRSGMCHRPCGNPAGACASGHHCRGESRAGAAVVEGLGCGQQLVPAGFVPHAEAGRLPVVGGRRRRIRRCRVVAVRDRPGRDDFPGHHCQVPAGIRL